MNSLVFARDIKGRICLTENRVTKSQRESELSLRQALDKPFNAAVVKFDRVPPNASPTAEAQSDAANRESNDRVGRCPKYADEE